MIDRFASVRFTIGICILLAAVSLLGTVVPQGLDPREYTARYGEFPGRILTGLGIADLYHSWGFILLLCVLAINLLACTGKRFPAVWRSLRRDPSVPSDATFEGWRNVDRFSVGLREGWADTLAETLTRTLGKPRRDAVLSSGDRVFLFERNRVSRMGPYLVHVSILIILAGALVGALFGFKGNMILPEGASDNGVRLKRVNERHTLDFHIRCNRFEVEFYPNGTPREYRSEVSILDRDGQTVIRDADIRVNHPLTFRGITFYQSTYGELSSVVLDVLERETGEHVRLEVEPRTPFPLPGESGDRGWVVKFVPNMRIPPQMVAMTRFDRSDLGPAVQVSVFSRETGFGEPFWVLKDSSEPEETREGRYHFKLDSFRSVPYTGLQVAYDPGTPLVWAGCILLIIGFVISFLLDHEVLWVSAAEGKDGRRVEVRVAGRVARHPGSYAERFAERVAGLRDALGAAMGGASQPPA